MNLNFNKNLQTFTVVMFIAVEFNTNCLFTPLSRIAADTTKRKEMFIISWFLDDLEQYRSH